MCVGVEEGKREEGGGKKGRERERERERERITQHIQYNRHNHSTPLCVTWMNGSTRLSMSPGSILNTVVFEVTNRAVPILSGSVVLVSLEGGCAM